MDEYYKKVSFKEIIYDDISELEKAIKTKNELIKILIDLKDEHTHQRELKRLELKFELSKEKLLELDKKTYSSLFFQSCINEASTSKLDPNINCERQIPEEQKFEKRVERVAEIEISTIQSDKSPPDSQQDNSGSKYDDEDVDRQTPLLRKFFCC